MLTFRNRFYYRYLEIEIKKEALMGLLFLFQYLILNSFNLSRKSRKNCSFSNELSSTSSINNSVSFKRDLLFFFKLSTVFFKFF